MLFALSALLLWVTLFSFPVAVEPGLDPSWQLVLNYAWTHHLAFGREVVYTYGPWGWLTTLYYDPETFGARIVWELAWKGLTAWWTVRLAFSLPLLRRVLLIAGVALLLTLFGDALPLLVISGLSLSLLDDRGRRRGRAVVLGLLLGLLALQKFSGFVAVACGLAGVALHLVLHRNWRAAASVAAAGLAGVVAWWWAAGQNLSDLPAFVRHASWVAASYNDSMYFSETPQVLGLGLAAAACFIGLVWIGWRDGVIRALILTGFGFLAWKQAFVRADQHTFGFFFTMVFAGLAAPLLAPDTERFARTRNLISWLLVGLAVGGAYATEPGLMGNVHRLLRLHVVENTRTLLDLGARHAEVDRQRAATLAAEALPATRARVGSATIDQLGHMQTAVLFNQLNYHPRPVIQSYHACTAALAELNAAYYTSPGAPQFTLAGLESIDGRFPPLDDSRLLPRLFTDHDYVLAEKGYVLLQHRTTLAPFALKSLASGRLRFDETLPLPPFDGRALWVTIAINPSWQGWLRQILYKPPEVMLVINDGGTEDKSYRLILSAARGGFLISPVLTDTADLAELASTRTGRPARSIRLWVRPEDAGYFLKRAYVEVSALPALTFTAEGSNPAKPSTP